jgi:hypothetical protein
LGAWMSTDRGFSRSLGGGHSDLTLRRPWPRGTPGEGTPDRSKLFGSHGQRPWFHEVMREVAVLRILGLTARCRTYAISLLLVSSAVQGLTPAQQSLASSWGLLHFFSIQGSSDSAGEENDPPEEECVSTEPERRPDLHLLAGRKEALTTLSPRRMELISLRFRCPRGNLPSPDHLSIVLCRLTC